MSNEEPTLSVIRLADVQPERVSWLWPGRIPAGKLVTLDGDPSLGKSTLALSFAATVTTGGMWPDGSRCTMAGDVVLLSAEDGLADTVRPRLDAASADLTRVHAIEGIAYIDEDGHRFLRPLTLGDVEHITSVVREVSARLLIVDVLMAFLPSGTDSHKDQDIRRVLSRLSAMADETGCTILLLRHLNKAKGGDPMYRGGGSIGIVGAARAGMLVAADREDESGATRVLASTKSNLGPAPESLIYRLVDAGSLGVARVEWLGTTDRDARALLADHGDADSPGDHAEDEWLRALLATGPVKATEIYSSADANGYSKDQMKRSKARQNKRAGRDVIRAYQPTIPGPWFWSLDQGAQPAPQGADTKTPLPGDSVAPWQVSEGIEGAMTTPREPGSGGVNDRPLGAPSCSACHFPMALDADIVSGHHAGCQRLTASQQPPGGVTTQTPGMTDRVRNAINNAHPTTTGDDAA